MNSNKIKKRDGFRTNLGIIAATLGSAVGLGNIWKFPSLTGSNGGASFIMIYLVSTLLVGLPIMISEIMMGRRVKANAVTTMQTLSPGRQPWWLVGVAGTLASFLIMVFYTEVAGWVYAYIFKFFSASALSNNPAVTSGLFLDMIKDPVQALAWQWIVLLLVGFIIVSGVSNGIEKWVKKLMPILFVLLIFVSIRSLTLPGAMKGLSFLFKPDLSKITGITLLAAMGLSFFKLSLGAATMMTYGSYFRDDQNIPKTAFKVMLADLTVSMLAGMAIFPAVFAFGFEASAGPALLFITIPAVFASMPMGHVFVILFFVLAAVAATGAMVSLLEVPVAFFSEQFKLSREKATFITVLALMIMGSTAALSESLLSGVKPFGMSFFDLYDFLTSNLLMPIGGLCTAIFAAWVWGFPEIKKELSNQGALGNQFYIKAIYTILKWITPILVVIILANGLWPKG